MRERSQEPESRIQELDCLLFFILISKSEIRKSVARCQVSAVNGKSLSRIEDFKSLNFLIPNLQSKIYNLLSASNLKRSAPPTSNREAPCALSSLPWIKIGHFCHLGEKLLLLWTQGPGNNNFHPRKEVALSISISGKTLTS
jgi:hypothetical protein